jgi:hypothetical protein
MAAFPFPPEVVAAGFPTIVDRFPFIIKNPVPAVTPTEKYELNTELVTLPLIVSVPAPVKLMPPRKIFPFAVPPVTFPLKIKDVPVPPAKVKVEDV